MKKLSADVESEWAAMQEVVIQIANDQLYAPLIELMSIPLEEQPNYLFKNPQLLIAVRDHLFAFIKAGMHWSQIRMMGFHDSIIYGFSTQLADSVGYGAQHTLQYKKDANSSNDPIKSGVANSSNDSVQSENSTIVPAKVPQPTAQKQMPNLKKKKKKKVKGNAKNAKVDDCDTRDSVSVELPPIKTKPAKGKNKRPLTSTENDSLAFNSVIETRGLAKKRKQLEQNTVSNDIQSDIDFEITTIPDLDLMDSSSITFLKNQSNEDTNVIQNDQSSIAPKIELQPIGSSNNKFLDGFHTSSQNNTIRKNGNSTSSPKESQSKKGDIGTVAVGSDQIFGHPKNDAQAFAQEEDIKVKEFKEIMAQLKNNPQINTNDENINFVSHAALQAKKMSQKDLQAKIDQLELSLGTVSHECNLIETRNGFVKTRIEKFNNMIASLSGDLAVINMKITEFMAKKKLIQAQLEKCKIEYKADVKELHEDSSAESQQKLLRDRLIEEIQILKIFRKESPSEEVPNQNEISDDSVLFINEVNPIILEQQQQPANDVLKVKKIDPEPAHDAKELLIVENEQILDQMPMVTSPENEMEDLEIPTEISETQIDNSSEISGKENVELFFNDDSDMVDSKQVQVSNEVNVVKNRQSLVVLDQIPMATSKENENEMEDLKIPTEISETQIDNSNETSGKKNVELFFNDYSDMIDSKQVQVSNEVYIVENEQALNEKRPVVISAEDEFNGLKISNEQCEEQIDISNREEDVELIFNDENDMQENSILDMLDNDISEDPTVKLPIIHEETNGYMKKYISEKSLDDQGNTEEVEDLELIFDNEEDVELSFIAPEKEDEIKIEFRKDLDVEFFEKVDGYYMTSSDFFIPLSANPFKNAAIRKFVPLKRNPWQYPDHFPVLGEFYSKFYKNGISDKVTKESYKNRIDKNPNDTQQWALLACSVFPPCDRITQTQLAKATETFEVLKKSLQIHPKSTLLWSLFFEVASYVKQDKVSVVQEMIEKNLNHFSGNVHFFWYNFLLSNDAAKKCEILTKLLMFLVHKREVPSEYFSHMLLIVLVQFLKIGESSGLEIVEGVLFPDSTYYTAYNEVKGNLKIDLYTLLEPGHLCTLMLAYIHCSIFEGLPSNLFYDCPNQTFCIPKPFLILSQNRTVKKPQFNLKRTFNKFTEFLLQNEYFKEAYILIRNHINLKPLIKDFHFDQLTKFVIPNQFELFEQHHLRIITLSEQGEFVGALKYLDGIKSKNKLILLLLLNVYSRLYSFDILKLHFWRLFKDSFKGIVKGDSNEEMIQNFKNFFQSMVSQKQSDQFLYWYYYLLFAWCSGGYSNPIFKFETFNCAFSSGKSEMELVTIMKLYIASEYGKKPTFEYFCNFMEIAISTSKVNPDRNPFYFQLENVVTPIMSNTSHIHEQLFVFSWEILGKDRFLELLLYICSKNPHVYCPGRILTHFKDMLGNELGEFCRTNLLYRFNDDIEWKL